MPKHAETPSETVDPRPAQRALLAVIRFYQIGFGWMYAGSCRFVPSCSAYAAEAVARFGVFRGSALAVGRLARCHPLGGSGLDPVPDCAPSESRCSKPDPAGTEQRRGESAVPSCNHGH